MIPNEDPDYSTFDTLILQNRCFAVYRNPGDTTIHFIMQQDEKPRQLQHLTELNAKEGFVIAPFAASEKTPVVLIHPDIVLEGENIILEYLVKETTFIHTKQAVHNTTGGFFDKKSKHSGSFSTYEKAFELFQDALRFNICEKIVLSRTLDMSKPSGFSAGNTFRAAFKTYPEAFVYLCHSPLTGTWLGSSPELILSGKGTDWQTVALAGTKDLSMEKEIPDWDQKNIREQHIVADYLEKQLNALNLVHTKNGPFASKAGKLMHLKTEFSFQMNDNDKIGDLLESLHPTPAVCGFPKQDAYTLILNNEGYDRTYYSGFVGELSMKGKTGLFVNLRCMQIGTNALTLFAGGGLLTSSELKSEWEETEAKLQTILSLIEY